MLKIIGPLTGLILALSCVQYVKGQERPKIALKLVDQFGDPQDLDAYRGHVVVLLFGDKNGAKKNQALGEKLHVHYHPKAKGLSGAEAAKAPVIPVANWQQGQSNPNVYVIPVACVGKVPESVQYFVRQGIKTEASDVPVWIDFEDKMKNLFGVREDAPNLVVIDAWGRKAWLAAGELDEKTSRRLIEVIDYLRTEPNRK